jgi:hypothetical protein
LSARAMSDQAHSLQEHAADGRPRALGTFHCFS